MRLILILEVVITPALSISTVIGGQAWLGVLFRLGEDRTASHKV